MGSRIRHCCGGVFGGLDSDGPVNGRQVGVYVRFQASLTGGDAPVWA